MITPQTVRGYQPVFSGAFIAHIEATRDTIEEKNRLCGVVPLPNTELDFLKLTSTFMVNQFNWSQDAELRQWLYNNRLDGFSQTVANVALDDDSKRAVLKKLRDNAFPAVAKLEQYIADPGSDHR